LTELILQKNLIVNFNPTNQLPNGLKLLNLRDNLIVSFNPSLSLPITLTTLNLRQNRMTTSGYATSQTWATAQPSFTSTCVVSLNTNTNSAAGTVFETILISKNANVTT
jgi:hypothetical protein